MHLATKVGSLEAVVELLAAGANVNKPTISEKNTPLHIVSAISTLLLYVC